MEQIYKRSWLDLTTSLFKCPADNSGLERTLRQILFNDFAVPHEYGYEEKKTGRWIKTGEANDIHTIAKMRQEHPSDEEKKRLKKTIQCFTVAACFQTKQKAQQIIKHYNLLMGLDFDHLDDYDIEATKQAIFDLPFVGYTGLSVSGKGLFAIIHIAEPEKLELYAEHCFKVFKYYGLPIDTSKGRNYSDLRFVSYDSNALYREFPAPLRIEGKALDKPGPVKNTLHVTSANPDRLAGWAVKQIQSAEVGNRFETVRKVSYTLGGAGYGLQDILNAINNSSQYAGLKDKYFGHARDAFKAGQLKPLR